MQSQTPSPQTDGLAQSLHKFTEVANKETLYIQTSKGVYETGEDLWFKIYVLDARSFSPSALNEILYIELKEEASGVVVWQEKYEIKNGFVDGHLYINDDLLVGNYLLSAFSASSFDGRSNEFYHFRKIKVVDNILDKKENVPDSLSNGAKVEKIQFTLFPEGGNLVSGIKNTLAFKAVDDNGNPITVTGNLYENGKSVLVFNSVHAGMGSFKFVPLVNNKYYVKLIQQKGGTTTIHSIPEVLRHSKALQLAHIKDQELLFNVVQNPTLGQEKIYLRLQIRGVVYFVAEGTLKDSLKIRFPIDSLPQGIAEATLFNHKLAPLAERLVYVNHNNLLNIKTEFSKKTYAEREKVTLKIKVSDKKNRPISANLGISVYDRLYKNPYDAKNILTHYYLSTQLRGRIYDPGYYFDKANENRTEALDLLLLTQGWRKYQWNEEVMSQIQATTKQVLSRDVRGQLSSIQKKGSIPLTTVMIYNPLSKDENFKLEILDSTGRFALKPDHLRLGRQLYIKHFGNQNDKVNIRIEDPFEAIHLHIEDKTKVYPIADNVTIEDIPMARTVSEGGINLDEVEVSAKKTQAFRDKYLGQLDSLARLDVNDYVCEVGYLNCPIPAHRNSDKNTKPVDGVSYKIHKNLRPSNGKAGYIWGFIWDGYTLSAPYNSKKLSEEELLRKNNLTRVMGYYGRREFYQPNYDIEDDPFSDHRNTLLWKPELITDENGEATLEFYCSDINTHFLGVIEGVGGEGLLGRQDFGFFVSKSKTE